MSRRWETVAVNRGLNLRVRESLEEALLWLGLFPSLLTPQSLEDRRDEIQKGFSLRSSDLWRCEILGSDLTASSSLRRID
jgi:hypothetical protein